MDISGKWLCIALILLAGPSAAPATAAKPLVPLGPADEMAMDQPRVAVELVDPQTGQVVGPNLANTFLLDTGANSILADVGAVSELMAGGYQTEGTFFEQGIGGFTEFDVSAPYRLRFAGTDGIPHELDEVRILSSAQVSLCPIPGLCSFFGVAGMPLMQDRVTTLNLSSLGGSGEPIDILDILDGILDFDFLETTFSNELPSTALRRFSVPVTPLHFEAEGDGPLPSWTDLPSLSVAVAHGGARQAGSFVLDTGAQLSLMSSGMAFDLGLDTNGNGDLTDEAIGTQQIGGIGGMIDAPLLLVEELYVPTAEGVELVFNNLTMAIVDIDPTIDGIFGMNFLSSGWTGALLGDWGDLADLLNDAGMADLLEELGGLGQGLGSPYPFFEKVHFDFRDFQQGQGRMVLDLMSEVGPIESADGTHGDVDHDGDVDFDDREQWVHDIKRTYFGDANLDGVFDSHDMVQVFQAGEYEDRLPENSSWFTGDWNGDYEFDSHDMVLAFQEGTYEQGPRPAVGVPEPSALLLFGCGALLLLTRRGNSRFAAKPPSALLRSSVTPR